LRTLGSLGDVETDSLSFVQRFVAATLDRGEVNENVLATINLDEAKSLLGVEPLDLTFSHAVSPFYKIKIALLTEDALSWTIRPLLSSAIPSPVFIKARRASIQPIFHIFPKETLDHPLVLL
jgi:hypothetical protein